VFQRDLLQRRAATLQRIAEFFELDAFRLDEFVHCPLTSNEGALYHPETSPAPNATELRRMRRVFRPLDRDLQRLFRNASLRLPWRLDDGDSADINTV
jgi:hypothetical protein